MNRFLIVNSEKDPAGNNIHQRIIENFEFKKTEKVYDSLPVYSYENILLASSQKQITDVGSELDEAFGTEDLQYVFISKHRAESQVPSLTAHSTGNFGANEFGGNPKEISKYSPSTLKRYLLALTALRSEIPQKYNITLEATHHGPTSLLRPSIFVELGSTPNEWSDQQAASCIAKALIRSLKNYARYNSCAVALGGTHYPEKFNKLILETEIALGVIVPKYALESIDDTIFSQILQKSEEKVTIVVIDNKGLGKHKGRIVSLVEAQGLEILKV
jgi:D-aminoacyl-tRNA deacylase